jgi:hypothetical protein
VGHGFVIGSRQGQGAVRRERMTVVRVRPIHVIHSVAVLAVVTQLVFASLFLADTLQTSASYDALTAHRVQVQAHQVACFGPGSPNHFAGYFDNCFVTYRYQDHHFHAWIDRSWGLIFYVDPYNTVFRMNKSTYDHATVNINSDIAFAVLLLLGAVLVTIFHQYHLYRRRRLHHFVIAHHGDETLHQQALSELQSGSIR